MSHRPIMKYLFASAAIYFTFFSAQAFAQPIRSPFIFIQSGSDTAKSAILPAMPTKLERIKVMDGHFAIDADSECCDRIRIFGTELEWTSQFLSASEAHILAKRLHKLGFNAVRLVDNDYPLWNQASLVAMS